MEFRMVARSKSSGEPTELEDSEGGRTPSGSQTLQCGLDVIDTVMPGPLGLAELAETLGLTRSTSGCW
jgi:hypothetical protein